ncbi:helicase [Pseudomonas matsuisoli]|uniref:Helicase n=1 Tax=Pseudomonas matsuisoli TaxID=1515666 RepID=A0A917UXT3_9PSED|nr:helicase [Pseudomonas matsuisoli]GGJ94053.1 hypothetical protein GCM10009304_20120 [Pseudomonas matsuisoli]
MKFRFLLWMLGRLMRKAALNDPAFREQLGDKDLSFQLFTLDGKVSRVYRVHDQRVASHEGTTEAPAFGIGFRDADYGFATLTAKNKQLAFMQGIQDKHIQISGNPALVMWFQGLASKLKKPKAVKAGA